MAHSTPPADSSSRGPHVPKQAEKGKLAYEWPLKTDAEVELLKPAIAELLRTIPETWAECNLDSLTPIQTSAFYLLLAAGMVERRGWVRPTIANHPAAEGGFARVVEAAAGQAGEADNRPAIHAAVPLEWRLTADGTLARNLLGSETQAAVVFDFVLKLRNQPFTVPGCWIRVADDKEQARHLAASDDLATPTRPDVVGEGRLVAVRKLLQPATPAAFDLRNFMQAFDKLPWVKPKDPATVPAAQTGDPVQGKAVETPTANTKPRKAKRSTQPGGARLKLIAALTEHHEYAKGGCLNLDPIGHNELARLADVGQGSANRFFDDEFGGYENYRTLCADKERLIAALKLLNQEFTPQVFLYGARPPGEGERDD
jgi:hypothetical protein